MLHTAVIRLLFALLIAQITTSLALSAEWPEKGSYRFTNWAGPALGVYYTVPPNAGKQSPILIVVPGARRNAGEYRDAWHDLAMANAFVTLTIEGREEDFPSEYAYNAGGVMTSEGKSVAERLWTYSAIEPLFDDFREQFQSQRERYSIYGHSAGGQFVLSYLLFKPDARVDRAVAANPAFCPMPGSLEAWPFGLRGAPLPERAVQRWLAAPMVLLLGDRDLAPRTRPLSNGPLARAQGPHVFARGLAFHQAALLSAQDQGVDLQWKLEIVQGVGHSHQQMASHAVKYVLPR